MPGREQSPPQATAAAGARDTGAAARKAPSGAWLPLPGMPTGVSTKRILWLGGLATLAAVEVIEWPVAMVIGAGTWVAERLARDAARESGEDGS